MLDFPRRHALERPESGRDGKESLQEVHQGLAEHGELTLLQQCGEYYAPQQLYRLGLGLVFKNQPDCGQRRQDVAHEYYHRELRHALKTQNNFFLIPTFFLHFIWVTLFARDHEWE